MTLALLIASRWVENTRAALLPSRFTAQCPSFGITCTVFDMARTLIVIHSAPSRVVVFKTLSRSVYWKAAGEVHTSFRVESSPTGELGQTAVRKVIEHPLTP